MQMTFNCPLWFRRWAQLNSRGGSPCNRVPIAFCCGWMCSKKAWFDPSIVMYRRLAPDRIAEMQMHWFSLQTHFGLSFSHPTGRIQPRCYHWLRCKVYLQCVVENPLWKKEVLQSLLSRLRAGHSHGGKTWTAVRFCKPFPFSVQVMAQDACLLS